MLHDNTLVHFQQGGKPSHYNITVHNWPNENFPQRLIERRGAIEWTPKSPDLLYLVLHNYHSITAIVLP